MKNKYFPPNQLKTILQKARSEKKSISLANGGFDILHAGHIRYLKEAKQLADILVVALNSDRSLRLLKGPTRPVIDEKSVDKLLLVLKPDFHCKGSDYTEETVPERETVQSYGGKTVIVGGAKIRSTSQVIKSIKNTAF